MKSKDKKLTAKEIAKEVLFRIEQHRASWDNGLREFTLGDMWQDRIEPYLYEHAKYSAFAMSLKINGWQAPIEELCKLVIERKLK